MKAYEKYDIAYLRQVSPNWIPFTVNFEPHVFRQIVLRKIDLGFGYWLRYCTCDWYNYAVNGAVTEFIGEPQIEFYVLRSGKQTAPLKPGLISSPAAYLPSIYGTGYNAAEIGSHKFLNYFFGYGETIEIHLTRGSNFRDIAGTNPAFQVQLLLHGYNVPEPKARIW